jgi:uridine kinase
MNRPYIVGITGGSASGKTFFLNSLMNAFAEEEICLISQDHYYRARHEVPVDENGVHNFDLPQAIDHKTYARHILDLREGRAVEQREYTFNNPNIVPKMLQFEPRPIIVVEGILVFYFKEIADLLDLKIFIDAKEHIKLKRRIIRDQVERGYDLTDVLYRWENHVFPTYEQYIKPSKADADLIIPNNRNFQKGLGVVKAFLRSQLDHKSTENH